MMHDGKNSSNPATKVGSCKTDYAKIMQSNMAFFYHPSKILSDPLAIKFTKKLNFIRRGPIKGRNEGGGGGLTFNKVYQKL